MSVSEPVLAPKIEFKSHENPIRRGSRNGFRFGSRFGGMKAQLARGLTECAELPGETIEGVSRAGRELDRDLVDTRVSDLARRSRVAGGSKAPCGATPAGHQFWTTLWFCYMNLVAYRLPKTNLVKDCVYTLSQFSSFFIFRPRSRLHIQQEQAKVRPK